ncbi:Benzaldehyde dehydrogenase [NAD(+)] [Dyella sp. AD56]|uniref:benzaldehyde dehydrogenase n=1 Tax=Dyella sp. AD56 TaxID=1528744 RepID=UPI000C848BE4|nr:benzaldehyde dehydrogenase [Dyella sp. AD56]PMQ04608.1 Benzaldehyde dehydrogenase [NAD(+)] [Dyella sp. AD56]
MSDKHSLFSSKDAWSGQIYSNGWKAAGLGREPVLDKATGQVIGQSGVASMEDVHAATVAARKAQKAWARLPAPRRGDIVREFSRLLLVHGDEIAADLVRESGSIRAKGQWEVHMAAREILEGAALASLPSGVLAASAEEGRRSVARRIPIGVVGIITPWNSPLLLAVRAVAPALTMGNAVILKPDLQAPVAGGFALARLLELAGLPDGLFHVLPGAAITGDALVREPGVDMISFTGSTRVGKQIGSIAGGLLKRVSLELGGNNPLIILEDADVERAASAAAWGSFFHQGQICLTTGRHLVHESIAEAYLQALVRHAKQLVVGNPSDAETQIGPVVNERQATGVDRIVSETLAKGATLHAGGSRDGLFFPPTVISGVEPGMPAFDEEIFGPVAAITVFKTDEEAIALANRSEYGLSAAVISPNLARAQAISDELHSGVIHINDQTLLHEVYGPIGGVGDSGNGFNHSTLTNADQFSEWQWITTRSVVPDYPF